MTEKKILLHTCCAPCGSASIERLINEGYKVALFFGNSNIDTIEEFEKRRSFVYKIAQIFKIEVIEVMYNHQEWLTAIQGFENEPERGKRCIKCFNFLLSKASETANVNNIQYFSTSLTISPHKNSGVIEKEGNKFDNYLHFDFKKKDGFKRSIELSEKFGLYRQNYCACEFSKNKKTDNL